MKNYIPYLFCLVAVLPQFSCDEGFEELNKNPFLPTETDIGPLFNQVIGDMRLGWNVQFYLHNETLYGLTQLAAETSIGFDNIPIGAEEMWSRYYRILAHIREIERRLDEQEAETGPEPLTNVRAQLKTLLAYNTFRLTDLFGDIPFFDAGKGFESVDLLRVKFDAQEDIYKHLLEELKWVEENINLIPDPTTADGTPYVSFGGFDNFFDNDMKLWRKFANSLRLRHALRMVEREPAFAEPILAEIIEGDLPVIEDGEDVALWPQELQWQNTNTGSVFAEHNRLRLGSNIWRLLSENDEPNGSGIFDPRAYIFFEPNNENEWAPFPQIPDADTPPAGGIPYGQQRDVNYAIKGNANIYSPLNYYLVRDEDYIPELILTAAEVNFIKAEVYLRGLGVPMNEATASNEYTLGLVNSMRFWQNIMANTTIWTNAPELLNEGDFFAVANRPELSIFTSDDKLNLIYTQRWMDNFRQPWEAFALGRRTGWATPREGEAPTFNRFSYPPSEAINNPENWADQVAKMGEDSEQVKIWWMN